MGKVFLYLFVIVTSYLAGTVHAAGSGFYEHRALALSALRDAEVRLGQCETSLSAVLEENLPLRQKVSVASFSMATLIHANPWLCGEAGNLGTKKPPPPTMFADLAGESR